jgi:two-component system CheB/CheR fusion protein
MIDEAEDADLPFILAVGISAVDTDALTQMLERGAGLIGMAVCVIAGNPPDLGETNGALCEKLALHTDLPVVYPHDGSLPLVDVIYVNRPGTVLSFRANRIRVTPTVRASADTTSTPRARGHVHVIDPFFESLAAERGRHCAVAVLSGEGADGVAGLHKAKGHGAVTIAQQPQSARFGGLPAAAIATGAVDLVLTPEHVLPQLKQLRDAGQANLDDELLASLLRALRAHTQIDFIDYKPSTIARRVERRMQRLGLRGAAAYAERLQGDEAEAKALKSELLVGVSRFFRDEAALEGMRSSAIPRLRQRAADQALRIWVPGCSTGEEAFTIAMLLEEALENLPTQHGFKMFATDIDPLAIEHSGSGEYDSAAALQLPAAWRERFFSRRGDAYVVEKSLREKVIFSRHDLLRDPPFSHLDLIACRNLLSHLKPPVQERIVQLFARSLRDDGILWLGPTETVGGRADQFMTLDQRAHLYIALPGRQRTPLPPAPKVAASFSLPPRRAKLDQLRPLLEALQAQYVPPCLVIDREFRLLYRFGEVDALLRLPVGVVSLDVRALLPEELTAPTTELLSRVRDGGLAVRRDLDVQTADGPRRFDLRARALVVEHETLVALFFEGLRDVPNVGTNHGERHSTESESSERWQSRIDFLESNNEEMQANNRELVAANQELQSTNEELQSVNEELHTVNAEFSEKVNELISLHDELERLLASVDVAILLLDDKLTIQRFNQAAARYLNILPVDAGRSLIDVANRLSYPQLFDDCSQALRNDVPISRRIQVEDGVHVQVQVRGQGVAPGSRSLVVTVTDLTGASGTQRQLGRLAVALEHTPALIAVIDAEDRIVHANRAFERSVGHDPERVKQLALFELVPVSERDRTHDAMARTRSGVPWRGVARRRRPDGGDMFELVYLVPTTADDRSIIRISEALTEDFVPYDRDRQADEPETMGPLCYCLLSDSGLARVIDDRALELLELSSEADFDPQRPQRFAASEDADVLRDMFRSPDRRALHGYRFAVRDPALARVVQVRILQINQMSGGRQLLIELAELRAAVRGYRPRIPE